VPPQSEQERPTTLVGTLERIVFQNDTTQWTVARVEPDGDTAAG